MPEMPDIRKLQRRSELWLALVIILAIIALSATAPGFLTLANVVDLLETYSVQSIMAMGLFVVLVSGGIDI
ncbi:MAG TPA: ABC transporter permease, partial [Rhizobium sp.]